MSDAKRPDIADLIKPKHLRAEIVFGVVSFAMALFLLTQIGAQTKTVAGRSFVSQPGFMSIAAIYGMMLFGVFELYFTWRRFSRVKGEPILPEMALWAKALEYALWFMAYVWLVPIGGYLPVTILFCVALTWRLGYRGARYLLAAAATGIATVLLFKTFLQVKIPGAMVYELFPDAIRNFLILNF